MLPNEIIDFIINIYIESHNNIYLFIKKQFFKSILPLKYLSVYYNKFINGWLNKHFLCLPESFSNIKFVQLTNNNFIICKSDENIYLSIRTEKINGFEVKILMSKEIFIDNVTYKPFDENKHSLYVYNNYLMFEYRTEKNYVNIFGYDNNLIKEFSGDINSSAMYEHTLVKYIINDTIMFYNMINADESKYLLKLNRYMLYAISSCGSILIECSTNYIKFVNIFLKTEIVTENIFHEYFVEPYEFDNRSVFISHCVCEDGIIYLAVLIMYPYKFFILCRYDVNKNEWFKLIFEKMFKDLITDYDSLCFISIVEDKIYFYSNKYYKFPIIWIIDKYNFSIEKEIIYRYTCVNINNKGCMLLKNEYEWILYKP